MTASDLTATPLRLRFAPSPTGSLHVGGARTALFNYLVAKRSGGAFVLRIEDTDASRNRPESEAAVLEDLAWLGFTWDEGPDVGGAYGPYRQSERTQLYIAAADELLTRDQAYPCFCTPQELEDDQLAQRAAGIVATRYSGRCASLSTEARDAHRAAGRTSALRLRMPPGRTEIADVVHGEVVFDHSQLGDIVLVRSNGIATYNFAAAIDDGLMEIDLVVRGDEHLANTPYQMRVLAALERRAPRYAHVPLILNEDHQKLSKRHQTVGVASYRNEGYLADALLDHLVLLGWSPGDDSEHWSLEELTARFSLERVGRAPAVYNGARLKAFNGRAIRALPAPALEAYIVERLAAPEFADHVADPQWVHHFAGAYREELETLGDIPVRAHALLQPPAPDAAGLELLKRPAVIAYLHGLANALKTDDALFTTPPNKVVPNLAKTAEITTKEGYMALRLALTGSEHGAPLVHIIELLGRDRVAERLART